MVKIYKSFFLLLVLPFVLLNCETSQQSTRVLQYPKQKNVSFDYYTKALGELENNNFQKAEQYLIFAINFSDHNSAFLYEELANCQISLSKFKEAETNYKKAIHLEKTNLEYYENLEHFYFSIDNKEKAQFVLNQILSIESNNENALYDMASISLSSKNYETAIKYYLKLLNLYPDNDEALTHLVRIYGMQQLYSQALSVIKKFRSPHSDNVVLQLEEAFCLKQLGHYKTAIEILHNIDDAYGNKPIVLQEMAACYYLMDDTTNAKRYLTKLSNTQQLSFLNSTMLEELTSSNQQIVLQNWVYLLSVDPLNLIAYYGSAKSYEKLNDKTNAAQSYVLAGKIAYSVSNLSLAKRCFKKAQKNNPHDPIITLLIAYLFEHEHEYQLALQEAKKGLMNNQSSFTLHYYIASLYDSLNKKHQAYNEYKKAYESNTNSIATLIKLGYLGSLLNYNNQSLKYFETAYSKTNDDSLIFVIGLSYLNLEQYDTAIQFLNKYKMVNPNDSKVYYYLGLSYFQLRNIEQTITNLNLAIEKNTNDIESYNFLGYLLAEHNLQLERAFQLIKKAVNAEPQNPIYLDSLGWVLFKLKRYKQSIEILETAKTNFEKEKIQEPTIYEHLGDVYYHLENYTKALLYFKKAYQLDKTNISIQKKIASTKLKL